MSQDLNAELSRIYERCIEAVRTIAALDPAKPVGGWDQYTCTAANEFAADVEMAWIGAHPEHEVRDTYRAIMSGVPIERESVPGDSPTGYITYGLTSLPVSCSASRPCASADSTRTCQAASSETTRAEPKAKANPRSW
ncbi:hypothetical protein [Streptomyces syringium]|uniref:hypothetical protein n=1 Tax=Streptomyces syringium TaxID=76729 RepID=UPI0037CE9613